MAGGVGERFWPASRKHLPKQFLNIVGAKTLIQKTVDRIGPLVPTDRVLIVSNQTQAPLIYAQLPALKKHQVLLEPCGKNTAPCIGLAAAFLNQLDPEGIMLVLPADHVIGEESKFLQVIQEAAQLAHHRKSLVTIGIKPHGPETGYGYIQVKEPLSGANGVQFYRVERFVEKPDRSTAEQFLKHGGYLWNSGMFVWTVQDILASLELHLPLVYDELVKLQKHIGKASQEDAIQKMYEIVPKLSIDYGVLEKAKNIIVAEGNFDWDDVGSWSSLERHFKKDSRGNVVSGSHVSTDTQDTIVISQQGIVATAGVKDLIIVHTKDAVLVLEKSRAQDVKKLLELMKENGKFKDYL